MARGLDGKVALVTGGSSGIGRATALCFAKHGARVVVADVDDKGSLETLSMITDTGGQAVFVKTDVTKAADVEGMVNKAVETYGRLDCAYNNAGIEGATASIVDLDERDWDRVIDVNLKGVWLCLRYQISQMLKQDGGAIVNTASIMGLIGGTNDCGYGASKHGVAGLTKTAAIEYARQGIRVNAVCPGTIDTPMARRIAVDNAEAEKSLIERHPIGRVGQPEEIAETVVWLCSDAASFVTGHMMSVDGGYIAQ